VRRFSFPSNRILFLDVFLVLWLVNHAHLFDPPYWDGLVGVYSQGVWLSRNHFSYKGLMAQPIYEKGGANVDLFYAFSPLFALLSHVLNPPSVFLIFHLVVLLCASWTVVLFIAMVRARRPLFWPGLLWILSAAADPIWSGQTASMYLEVPIAAVSGAVIYEIGQGQFGLAAAACVAAWFIKGTAILPALCCAVFAVAFGFSQRGLRNRKEYGRLALLLIPLPVMLLLKYWMVLVSTIVPWDLSDTATRFYHRAPALYPMETFELLILILGVAYWFKKRARLQKLHSEPDRRLMGFLLIFVSVFWGSFLIYPIALPRYLCMILFPMALLIAFLLREQPRRSMVLAGTILFINLINQNGRLLPRLSAQDGRSGHELERSREYLLDLEANRRLCHMLEEKAFDNLLMTKWPFTQMLRLPELGYVTRPLPRVVEAGRYSITAGAIPLQTFLQINPLPETLCLYAPNVFDLLWGPSLKPMEGEEVVLTDRSLDPPIVLYRRDWARLRRAFLAAKRPADS